MTDTQAFDEPLSVDICDGEIVLLAPSGPFGISLTASAALRTSEKLNEAAATVICGQLSHIAGERD